MVLDCQCRRSIRSLNRPIWAWSNRLGSTRPVALRAAGTIYRQFGDGPIRKWSGSASDRRPNVTWPLEGIVTDIGETVTVTLLD
jgi:hypothetical protein